MKRAIAWLKLLLFGSLKPGMPKDPEAVSGCLVMESLLHGRQVYRVGRSVFNVWFEDDCWETTLLIEMERCTDCDESPRDGVFPSIEINFPNYENKPQFTAGGEIAMPEGYDSIRGINTTAFIFHSHETIYDIRFQTTSVTASHLDVDLRFSVNLHAENLPKRDTVVVVQTRLEIDENLRRSMK